MKRIILLLFIINCSLSIAIAQPPNNLSGLKICIDPGHGGHSSNDRPPVFTDIPFWESDGNFAKALLLKQMLENRGATVILTRNTNDYPNDSNEPSLSARYTIANSNNVNWFHSIHSNALGGTNTSTNYSLVLVKEVIATRQPAFPQAVTMANGIYNNIRTKIRTGAWAGNILPGVALDYSFYGGTNGGFNLGVLNGLIMPGELSEGSFHDNYNEVCRLMNNDYRKTEAYGILNAFVEYYKIPYDTLGMIIGSQKNGTTPINNVVVRLLPDNKVYNGDAFNNGFFLFDSLPPGNYKVVYETPGYAQDTVSVTLSAVGRMATINPVTDQTNVPRNSTITISFIKQMDTAFVRSVFSISPTVTGTISWNVGNTVMTFTPIAQLAYKTSYTVSLTGMGNTLQPTVFVDNKTVTSNITAKPLSVTFQTASLPPNVTLTQPLQNDTNFTVTQNVGIRFSESMDTASVRAAFQIIPTTSGTFTWMTSGVTNNTLIWKPVTGSLEYNTNYTVTVGSGAKSIYGLAIDGNKDSVAGDPFVLQFRTQLQPTDVSSKNSKPFSFTLDQNYPNPFNPSTTIRFSIAELSSVSLKIFDLLGREASSLVNGKLNQGEYSILWDAKNYSSGIYFYKLTTEKYTSIKRMMLVK
jgi:N-acetylmuramoyl-L-alanine amidase